MLAVAASTAYPVLAQSVARIGVLNSGNPEPFLSDLKEGLRALGYAEGRNIGIEFRTDGGNPALLPGLAAELVRMDVRLIVASPTPAVEAAAKATRTIPIIMAPVGDPVASGFVQSLARPGGNVTGLSAANGETAGKCLEVMRELMPQLRRVAVLANANDAFMPIFVEHIAASARSMKIEVLVIPVKGRGELDAAFVRVKRESVPFVIVQPSLPRAQAAKLALKYKVPAMGATSLFPQAGGLASYSAAVRDLYRDAAHYVDQILRDAKPETLPVQQPTKFELIINLKTAKTLGVSVPPTLAMRAHLIQ